MNRNNSRRRVLKILSATLSSAYSTSDIFSPFADVWFIISSSSSLLSDWLQDQPIPKTFSTNKTKKCWNQSTACGCHQLHWPSLEPVDVIIQFFLVKNKSPVRCRLFLCSDWPLNSMKLVTKKNFFFVLKFFKQKQKMNNGTRRYVSRWRRRNGASLFFLKKKTAEFFIWLHTVDTGPRMCAIN